MGRYKVRLFEIFEGADAGERKIGQCAIAMGRKCKSIFLDRLQLLEPTNEVWMAAMQALLSLAGPGDYEYGWVLNLEPPRELQLAKIEGVSVAGLWPLIVQAVDFSRWLDWESYHRAISENSRRNAKVALRDMPNLQIDTKTGWRCLAAIPALIRLRSSTTLRKGLANSIPRSAASYAATILLCSRYMFTSIATNGRLRLSSFYGARFGGNTYYLEGGSASKNGGAAWHLLLSILRDAYELNPRGKIIMGYIDHSTHDDEASGGLLRSRAACRVTDYPTSVIDFRYSLS